MARPDRLLPLDNHYLRRIGVLEKLVGRERYLGWGREAGGFFVDVRAVEGQAVARHLGQTLHLALGAAIRAAKGVLS